MNIPYTHMIQTLHTFPLLSLQTLRVTMAVCQGLARGNNHPHNIILMYCDGKCLYPCYWILLTAEREGHESRLLTLAATRTYA